MNRSVFAPALALLLGLAVSTSAFAQAAPTPQAPAAKAKFASPLKGGGTIDVAQTPSKYVGKEIVTVFKIKNTSNAPIALLKIEEYWYDKGGNMVSSDTQRWRQPFLPGEVIEMTTKSPAAPGAVQSRATFSHANGTLKANRVKAMK